VCKKGETGLKRENFSNQKQFGWFGWEDDMIIFMGFGGGVQMVSLLDERLFFFFFFFFLPFPLSFSFLFLFLWLVAYERGVGTVQRWFFRVLVFFGLAIFICLAWRS